MRVEWYLRNIDEIPPPLLKEFSQRIRKYHEQHNEDLWDKAKMNGTLRIRILERLAKKDNPRRFYDLRYTPLWYTTTDEDVESLHMPEEEILSTKNFHVCHTTFCKLAHNNMEIIHRTFCNNNLGANIHSIMNADSNTQR